ncbi:mycofactocin system transcriptional regulator [Leifsonia sp. NPDC058230]|uniref:mycofactocin system transcriptional regulator n=1 Tax=Leifsonia sp. NPDC058230 TaxID=3346391 RepID=UPI0036D7E8F2
MNPVRVDQPGATRSGRQPSTTRAELSHIALQLFIERGFDETTVDDIAAAAGIGRRTLFRYFASKNDLPWGDFDGILATMREFLRNVPRERSLVDALHGAVIEFNRFPAEESPFHRERMELLLNVPALVAHSTLRYASWRQVVAEYAAERLGLPEDSLEPQAIAWTYLGVCLSAYEQWLRRDDAELLPLLDASLRMLEGLLAPQLASTVHPPEQS